MKSLRFKTWAALLAITALVALPSCTGNNAPAPTQTGSTLPTIPAPSASAPVSPVAQATFVDAVQTVMPSVVKIEVKYGPQGAPGQPTATGASGSGWVFRNDGIIVTNNHVVESAQSITVFLSNGQSYTPSAVKTDSSKDLAVLKIDAPNLTAAAVGDSSSLKLGQPVVAIGNALDLGIRVTGGLVSLLGVSIHLPSNQTMTNMIETDASINPGNSGGVLINDSGEVVGIPEAGLEMQGVDVESFGYAIPVNDALPVINTLISQLP